MKLSSDRLEEYNELEGFRNTCGLKSVASTIKERECLRCEKTFTSTGPHNRICNVCVPNNEDPMSWLYSKLAPSKTTERMRKTRRKK